MNKTQKERLSMSVFALCATIVVLLVAAIFVFVGSQAYQTFTVFHINILDFFFGTSWNPSNNQVGSLVLISGSILTTLLAVLISTPVSVGVAIFISEIAPPWAKRLMQPVLELFTGIPSIIYGFLGLVLLVPLIARIYNSIAGGFFYAGYGIIAAAIVLAIMILPTITTITVDAMSALPNGLREASLALGATRWQTIRSTLLPAASSGIVTGVILGTGRAIGETLAVSYVIGSNAGHFPFGIDNVYPYFHLLPTSTITVQLLLDFLEVTPHTLNFSALWTLAFVLLIISLLLVLASRWVASHSAYRVTDTTATPTRKRFWQRRPSALTEFRSVAR